MPQGISLNHSFSAGREGFTQLILEHFPIGRRSTIAAQIARDLDLIERERLVEKLLVEMTPDERENLLLAIVDRLPVSIQAPLLARLAAEDRRNMPKILEGILLFFLVAWTAQAPEVPVEELWAALRGRLAAPPAEAPPVTPPPPAHEEPPSAPVAWRPRVPGQKPDLVLTLAPDVELVLVHVPAGYFWMGSDPTEPEHYSNEEPKRWVYLDEYWIGKYPVTVAQFAAFVRANPYYRTRAERQGGGWTWSRESEWGYVEGASWQHPHGPDSDVRAKADHPVTLISWGDACIFCDWVGRVTRRVVRLPMEAEWEKAARGTDGRTYPWGTTFAAQKCNTAEGGIRDTTPVGRYSPAGDSPYGCADMAGNVWEWCLDRYDEDYYRKAPSRNPTGPSTGEGHVVRGGSWAGGREIARCAYRGRLVPDNWYYDFIGFRIVVSPARSEA